MKPLLPAGRTDSLVEMMIGEGTMEAALEIYGYKNMGAFTEESEKYRKNFELANIVLNWTRGSGVCILQDVFGKG